MIGGVLAVASVGSSLLGMYGNYRQSKEQEAVAKYNAKIAREKGIAQSKAILAQNRIESDLDREQYSAAINQLSNRGLQAGIGSPLLVAAKIASDNIADRNEMYRQARIAELYGEQESYMYNRSARSIRQALPISLLSQALGGGASAAGTYYSFKGE